MFFPASSVHVNHTAANVPPPLPTPQLKALETARCRTTSACTTMWACPCGRAPKDERVPPPDLYAERSKTAASWLRVHGFMPGGIM